MNYDVEIELLKLASDTRSIYDEGNDFFKSKRKKFDINFSFNFNNYLSIEGRKKSKDILTEYEKQLFLEKQFYEKTFQVYVEKINEILIRDEVIKRIFYSKSFPKILNDHELKISLNKEKYYAVNKSLKLISYFNNLHVLSPDSVKTWESNAMISKKVKELDSEINLHLEKQKEIALQQQSVIA